jgi:hypothetical protein
MSICPPRVSDSWPSIKIFRAVKPGTACSIPLYNPAIIFNSSEGLL